MQTQTESEGTLREHYIKVNFPDSYDAYLSGNGEGMWVLVDSPTKEAHDSDARGGVWFGTLDNDSFYYPGRLVHGMEVLFEMRGENRPCAVWEGFVDQLGENSKRELLETLLSNGASR